MSLRESLRATDLPSWTRLPWVDIAAVNAGVEKRPEILRLLIVMFFLIMSLRIAGKRAV